MPTLVVQHPELESSVRYRIPTDLDVMDDHAFYDWCQENDGLHIERSALGEIEIVAPSGWETGSRNNQIARQLGNWATQDGRGFACDSSTGYILPNRAERSPDASWILKERVETVPKDQREKFLPLCPDFVIELLSPSDSMARHQSKMEEFIANGASLGWLIDPFQKQVHIYRPGADPEILERPATVCGEGLMAGFTLDLELIFARD
ncbi:MAG: Uma2 family endonuclease [Verrucomicrobiales bacterium]